MATFAEFWPFYLREHSQPMTRTLHFTGTTLSLLLLLSALALRNGWPATFKYPLWSFAADWKMWALAFTRRLPAELARAGVKPPTR
jgi:hypothetical protein